MASMAGKEVGTTDVVTIEDLAAALDRYSEFVRPLKPRDVQTEAVLAYPEMSHRLRQSAIALRHHAQTRRANPRLKVVSAAVVAIFAVVTGFVGASSGWASYNIDLAYGLLIGGAVAAFAAGFIALYVGASDPTVLPRGP